MSYIAIDLGGEKRGLKFNMGTLRRIQELTKGDPLKFLQETDEITGLHLIVYAALLSNMVCKGEQPNLSREQVTAWLDDLSMPEFQDVAVKTFQTLKEAYEVPTEGNEDTRRGATDVARTSANSPRRAKAKAVGV